MKISLISPYDKIWSCGIGVISEVLKEQGHETEIYFLPHDFNKSYPDNVIDQLLENIKDSDLIGISVITNFFDNSVQITKAIKEKYDIPVLWGGIHPTVLPEESIVHADMIALGEAEEIITELTDCISNKRDCKKIKGLWVNKDGTVFRNETRELNQDISEFPFPRYNFYSNYILDGAKIQNFDQKLLEKYVDISFERATYLIIGSRGCLYNCTYCAGNNFEWKKFTGQNRFRNRSAESMINELKHVKDEMPFIEKILINDDNFFGRGISEIKDFSKQYKDNISLPLIIYGINPQDFSEEKLKICLDCGLIRLRMGIESGSENIKKLFKRNYSNQIVFDAANTINKYKDIIEPPLYDFILDNPWESDKDKEENIRFIKQLPRPFLLNPHSLIFFPGTELYEKAKSENLISDEHKEIYMNDFCLIKDTAYLKQLEQAAYS